METYINAQQLTFIKLYEMDFFPRKESSYGKIIVWKKECLLNSLTVNVRRVA